MALVDQFTPESHVSFRRKSRYWYGKELQTPEFDAVKQLTTPPKQAKFEPQSHLANLYIDNLYKKDKDIIKNV